MEKDSDRRVTFSERCGGLFKKTDSVVSLNKEFTILNNKLGMEKKKGEEMDDIKKAREQQRYWLDCDIGELTLEQLVSLEHCLEEFKTNVIQQSNFLKIVEKGNNAFHYPLMKINNPM